MDAGFEPKDFVIKKKDVNIFPMVRLSDLKRGQATGKFVLTATYEKHKCSVASIWHVVPTKFYNKYVKMHVGWYPLDFPILKTGLAPEIYSKSGAVNSILVESKSEDTLHLSHWYVSNTVYYNLNQNEFKGWMDLEFPYETKLDSTK